MRETIQDDDWEVLESDLDIALKALRGIAESESFEDARLQAEVALERLAHRPVQPDESPKRETGTVKWFDRTKGYGFIIRNQGGGDLFVPSTELRDQRYPWLDDGQRVEFRPVRTQRGLQAQDVVFLA